MALRLDAPEGETAPRRDGRYVAAALSLGLERIAPALLPALGVLALFLILALCGVFEPLEPLWRMGVTLGFAAAALAALWPARNLNWPSRADIERRLDLSRPEAHRPLATLADSPASGSDPVALALWSEHRRRAERAARDLAAGTPDPRLREKDRFALRAALALGLIAAFFVAGGERAPRLAGAFDWTTPRVPPVPPRLDAWIDPPAYTGRPPLFLSNAGADEVIRAPVGSVLSVRSTVLAREGQPAPAADLALAHGPGLEPPKAEPKSEPETKTNPDTKANSETKATPLKPGVSLERRVIRADETVIVRRAGREIAQYRLSVIPDLAPKVTLREVKAETAMPDRQIPGGIRIAYTLEDDYGIAKADLLIERVVPAGGRPERALYPAPTGSVPLRLGPGEMVLATEDHPWAGAEVRVSLLVEDDLGQSAQSEWKTITLPQRPFSQPVARALVEQRRNLNFSPDLIGPIRLAFDAMLYEPERYTPRVGDFLALDMIRAALRNARGDERLKEISERIYDLALYLENGDMSDAEKRLREAEARLREAIEREASADEIRRLTEELRRAMDQFLREFAERALKDQDRAQDRSPISPDRLLSQRDLNEMLRKIEEMARSGNMAEAQRMLNELRQLLENLRTARRQDVDPRMRELGEQIEELDRLQREQRDLRDRTFREGQQQRGQRQQGQQGQQGQRQQGQRGQGQQGQEGQGLQDQQQALRERLRRLRERLQQRGMQEGEGMGDAEDGMGDAENQLGQGRPGDATQGQQRALDGMGRAAQGMAQEMERQMGQDDEPGEGEGEGPGLGRPGPTQRGRAENRMDPLGRSPANQRRDFEDNTTNPNLDGGGAAARRAEQVLKELQRRLGEFERPREELDYLERLLRQR